MAHPPVLISARFRSGSTLLWNLFRHMPGCRAYYEPCHEHLKEHVAVNAPAGKDHVNVASYWDEYLPMAEELNGLHKGEFGHCRPYLEENERYPELKTYIRFLIDSAGEKTAVLQFNRMDFRLGWLRRNFADATILHLERDPRENWFSMVKGLPEGAWRDPLSNAHYDLVLLSLRLHDSLPFLFCPGVSTSYHRHFILWRLSGLMGRVHADLTLRFEEDIVGNTEETIGRLARMAGQDGVDVGGIRALVSPPPEGRWKQLAPPEWFDEAEAECDALLDELGLLEHFGRSSLDEIRTEHADRWKSLAGEGAEAGIEAAARLIHETRDEQYRIWRVHHEYVNRTTAESDRLRAELSAAQNRLLEDNERFQSERERLLDRAEKLEISLDDLRTENEISQGSLSRTQELLACCESRLRKR